MPDISKAAPSSDPRARLASMSGLDYARGMRDGTLAGRLMGEHLVEIETGLDLKGDADTDRSLADILRG